VKDEKPLISNIIFLNIQLNINQTTLKKKISYLFIQISSPKLHSVQRTRQFSFFITENWYMRHKQYSRTLPRETFGSYL